MGLTFSGIRDKVAKFIAPPSLPPSSLVPSPKSDLSASGNPYEGAASGRRSYEWNPSRLGPTTTLWSSLDLMQARSRDAVRNNPWASSAVDTFEAQVIGNGIHPHWNIKDPDLKRDVETKFRKWAESTDCDPACMLNFYGQQALASREIFEAGEVLARTYDDPVRTLEIQLIESEQMPIWRNFLNSNGTMNVPVGNSVRAGVEFDPKGRKIAYHMYKEHPGETMLFPLEGLQFVRIPAEEMLHCFKPRRARQIRGVPHLASVLGLLRELDEYTDAAVVKKKIQTFFAGIITKNDPNDSILPNAVDPASVSLNAPFDTPDLGTEIVKLEPGVFQNLLPGESITFPNLPAENDLEMFMDMALHKFAVGVGLTHEQLTGNLKGVNLSSIRAGLIDVRRKLEQFQLLIIVTQFCRPVVLRWMRSAMLNGIIKLPGYARDPFLYTDISFSLPGWPWTEPEKEVGAAVTEIRAGLNDRDTVAAGKGRDAVLIDQRQAEDNRRTEELNLIYDSNSTKVATRGESRLDATPADGTEGDSKPQSGFGSDKTKRPALVK